MLFYFESVHRKPPPSLQPQLSHRTVPSRSDGVFSASGSRSFSLNLRCFYDFCCLHGDVNTLWCPLCLPRFFAHQISSVCSQIVFCVSFFFLNNIIGDIVHLLAKVNFKTGGKQQPSPEFTWGKLRKVRTIKIHRWGCRSIFIKLIRIFDLYC